LEFGVPLPCVLLLCFNWLQVVVNALVTLLEAGRFQQWQAHRPAHASDIFSSSSGSSGVQTGADVAMGYIVQLLAAGRVNAKPDFVVKLLQHLVAKATAAAAAAAAAATEAPGQDAAALRAAAVAPFEQQFMSIVQVVGVQQPAAAAITAGVSSAQSGGVPLPVDAAAFSPAQAKQVLQLAKQCNFLRAAATVHHLQGNYAAALSCYLALQETATHEPQHTAQALQPHQQQQTQQPQQQLPGARQQGLGTKGSMSSEGGPHPQAAPLSSSKAVFGYISSVLAGGGPSPQARQLFLKCVVQQVVPLIRLDPTATAALMLQHMPEQQVPVLLGLQDDPELQFQFLRAAMQQNQLQAQRASASGTAAGAAGAAAGSGVESLLERPEVAILYVKLLARFQASAVLPFLQSHHNYSVAEAITVCRAAGEGSQVPVDTTASS
jgi:hypothetical protein